MPASQVKALKPFPHISRANLKKAMMHNLKLGANDKAPRLSKGAQDAILITAELFMEEVFAHVNESRRVLKRTRVMPAMVSAAFQYHHLTVLGNSCA